MNEFLAIKEIIANGGSLSASDVDKETYLYCDPSRRGLGFILVQKGADGKFYIIQCGSTSLNDAQSRYAVVELELLSVVYALDKLHFYLH